MPWNKFLKNKTNRINLVISLGLLSIMLFSLTNFLNYVESRQGAVLSDPILSLFSPVDLTWLTFLIIYLSLILAIFSLFNNPERLIFAIQLYSLMVIIRIIAMFLVPLDPPEKMIMLNDPFVEFFGTGQTLTKDLFFSGHTATLFILYLVTENKILKYIFFLCTIAVAVSVILQHVHYTIDVFAAPFFTYTSYIILKIIRTKLNLVSI